jgi:hypothetical protein
MNGKSLIDLSELSKPATVLIEKVSDAVGGIFKPYQIVRVAKAEALGERIRAEGQIEISDLQRRAFHRFLEEEAMKQTNMENITKKALPHLADESKPDQLDDDWLTNFFDRCRLVSDEEMQTLWSRVLAGEANSPGTYSKRTVNFLSSLDKSDAELFTRLCSFLSLVMGVMTPLVYDPQHSMYTEHGINFSILSHLESIGLIQFDHLAGFVRTGLPKKFDAFYYDAPVSLEMPNESDNSMSIGKVMLTKIGYELAPICGSQPIDGFLDFIREEWTNLKYLKEDTPPQAAPDDPLPPSQK